MKAKLQIVIEGITLAHRTYYEGGWPVSNTTGRKGGQFHSIDRDMDSPGYPWALWVGDCPNTRLVRHLTADEVAEYKLLLASSRARDCQGDADDLDDLTAEVERGAIAGGASADI